MRTTPVFATLILITSIAVSLLPGCGPGKEERPAIPTTAAVPAFSEAAGATLRGLEGDSETVTLTDGRWEGPPFVEGSSSRPSISLVPGFLVPWNADGAGPDEAVVLATENSGGSGEYIYLVVIAREGAGVVNRATALLGDRVQVVSVEPSGRTLKMTVLRAGPEGALCCPDEVADETWELREGALAKLPPSSPSRPLTIAIIAGTEWTLEGPEPGDGATEEGNSGASAPAGDSSRDGAGLPAITLRYSDGRFEGHAGCNRYFMPVREGEFPGDIAAGPAGSTRMACPDRAAADLEALYLARLGSVVKFGFSACRLMLQYEGEAGTGILYYRRP